jgi:hypothetical protein
VSVRRLSIRARRAATVAAALALLSVLLLGRAGDASAQSFPVTSVEDGGMGTLREAIREANEAAGPDRISIQATGTILLSSELPEIEGDLEIVGPGSANLSVRRNGSTDFRIFTVGDGVVSISGLSISNGHGIPSGGGIYSIGELSLRDVRLTGNLAIAGNGPVVEAAGGGIFSAGPLSLAEVSVRNNSARAINGFTRTVARGGGIAAISSVTVLRSTISRNRVEAESSTGNVTGTGGGASFGGSEEWVRESTVSENEARVGAPTEGSTTATGAGGLLSASGLVIVGSTITGNTLNEGESAQGANLGTPETTAISDTIVSDPHGGANCSHVLSSGGFNIEEGASCGFNLSTDMRNTDPRLNPTLGNSGGLTETYALEPTSPAIDHGRSFGFATDQRGMPRPVDIAGIANGPDSDGSDVGAFEAQPAAAAATPAPVSKDRKPPNTRIVKAPNHKTSKTLAHFVFAADEPAHFECKLDAGRFQSCGTHYRHRSKPGTTHVLKVRAVDLAGNVDPSPARYVWHVNAPPLAAHHGR